MPHNPPQRIPVNIQDIPVVHRSSRRIVLLGKTGVGKSAAGNTILGQRAFRSQMRMNAVTRECSAAHATVSGRSVSVVDTPGFFDTQINTEETVKEIARSVYISSPGPHAFLIVFPVNNRFTEQEQQIPQMIEMIFGQEVLKYSIIVFTHGDQLDGESVEELIQENRALRGLVGQCGGRFHVFSNRDVNDRDQVNDLLMKIDTMIEQNGGGHYSNQMYADALRFRQEEEEEERRQRLRQREIERVVRETEQRIREEYEDPQDPSSGFLLFLSNYQRHIYMAVVAAGVIIGGAVGGAVVYGVVGGAIGGAIGGGVAGAVVGGVESGTVTGAVKGAAVGAVGGAAVGAAVAGVVAGGAAAATTGAVAKAVCVGTVGGAAVGGVAGGASTGTVRGAVEGALAGAAVGGAAVGGALSGAVGGAAVCGAIAGGAVGGGVVGGAVSGTVDRAFKCGVLAGGAVLAGAAFGGAVG